MYTSFADMLKAHKAAVTAEAPEAKPAQPLAVAVENLSVTDDNGRQCCPNCRTPFLGLGPTCYYC
jgi:hypothetical protein